LYLSCIILLKLLYIGFRLAGPQPYLCDDSVMAETYREDQHHNKFSDMYIVGPLDDAVTDVDYIQVSPSSQEDFGRSIVVTNPNLSNFSSNVTHDM